MQTLDSYLDKRLAEAHEYPNIRHAINDAKGRINKFRRYWLTRWFKFIVIGLWIAVFVIPWLIPVYFGILFTYIIWAKIRGKSANDKIFVLALNASINDKTEDKLNKLYHQNGSYQFNELSEYEIFQQEDNPWIT